MSRFSTTDFVTTLISNLTGLQPTIHYPLSTIHYSLLLLGHLWLIPATAAGMPCTSTTSGNWSLSSIWDCSLVPSNTDDVVIANGHTVTLDMNPTVNHLTINLGGILNSGILSNLTVKGDWTNNGTLSNPGCCSAVIFDSGSSHQIMGNTTFNHLTFTPTSAQTLTFQAGSTTTIANNLTLTGTAGNLLSLRSSIAGTQFNINPQSTMTLDYLDVKDSNNQNGAAGRPKPSNSVDSGNNIMWFCGSALTVTSTTDSGPGSLRQALTDICDTGTVTMNVNGNPIGLTTDLNITQNVTIDANNQVFNVTGGNFVAPGKNITITNASNINVVIIDTSTSSSTPAGNISLTATGNIMLQSLHADSDSTGNAGKGGDITINAGGNIFTMDILSFSKSVSSGTASNSGDIQLISTGGNITTNILIARSLGITGSGNGGIINVQAVSGNIFINNGYLITDSSHGAANNITLTANTIRITGVNSGKSIIANGATANGTVTITTGTSPFTVGNATTNGTAGDIYQSATNNMTASPLTTLPPYYPPAGININNITCQNAITVTSTADSGAGSLRDATASLCPGGTITLNASPINLTSGALVINKDMTITTVGGVNQTVQRNATGYFNIFTIASGIVRINNLTIAHGFNYSSKGGIEVESGATLTLNNSTVSENRGDYSSGGGIKVKLGATLTVNNSTVSGNTAYYGGGIYNDGTATVTNSTVSGNTGSDGGGGIYNNGTLTVTNSTFSTNIAGIPTSYGGGIKNTLTAVLTVTNSTFSGNSAGWSSGGGGISNSGTFGLANTIIANSTNGGDCMSGGFTFNTNNLIQDGSCGSPLNITGDPLLGPLQNNGGITPTFELLAGSPAIDAGDNASCPTIDQRGLSRPQGSLCDIGAYEFQYSQLTLVMGKGGSSVAVSPLGISCGTDCNSYSSNTTITLTATPTTGYTFSGWTGTNCANTLTLSTDTTCTANFTLIPTPPPVVTTDPPPVVTTDSPPPTSEPVVCANQLTVTSTADNNAGSLREAIANLCPDGTITIKASPIELTSGELLITKNLTMTTDQGNKIIQRSNTAPLFRIFRILSMATVNFNHLTLTQGNADTENGGSIMNSGDLTLEDCIITANVANEGGGIYNDGTLRLIRSTMLANSANNSGGGLSLARGTGTVANTTFSGNSATQGGGLYVNSPATATVLNSTLADNTGGGITFAGQLLLHNSILAHSEGGDCVQLGTLAKSSNNLIADGSCQATFAGDPLLAPVSTTNSSSQLYYALLADSPAIGAGDVSICAATPVNGLDQRGLSRSPDHCDIGAYEYFILCEEQSEIPLAECQTLVDLYQNTNGHDWSDLATNRWNRTTTPCAWLGVKCENGHVVQIYRDSKNLVGTLPNLTTLDNLTALLLPNNTLTNFEVTQLPTSLQTLNLTNTGLTGNFPKVSGLPQLQILKLADNGLTGTLTADNLPNSLQELDVTHNQLTGSLPDLSQFNQLQRLLLGRNSFEGVTEFNFHPQLTTLIVSNNALRGELPDSLHKFNQLTTLDLGYNAWWAKNDSIAEFLSTKHPGWETTQTVTPTQLQAIALAGEAIQLTWTPILYTGDGGYYEVRYATQAGGPFDSLSLVTPDKTATNYTVMDLQPETTYYFVVRSFTPAHGDQANDLFSDWSEAVSATTPPALLKTPATYYSIPVVESRLDFGYQPQGTTMTKTLHLGKVAGEETLIVSNPVISGPQAENFQLISPAFPLQILLSSTNEMATSNSVAVPTSTEAESTTEELEEATPAGMVTVTIQCTANQVIGDEPTILQFTSNDPLQPTPTYQLFCQGVSLPPVVQKYTIDLGASPLQTPITATLPVSTAQAISHSPTLEVSEIAGPDAADFSLVPTAEGEGLVVQCIPSKLGRLVATLSIALKTPTVPDLATPSRAYFLICTGTEAVPEVVPEGELPRYFSLPLPSSFWPLGSYPVGTQTTRHFFISNDEGVAELQVDWESLQGPDAAVLALHSPTLPLVLPPHAPLQAISFTCTPSKLGLQTATLHLRSNDPAYPTPTYVLTCIGQGEGPLYDSLPAPGAVINVGNAVPGQLTTQTLMVVEVGKATLELTSSLLSGPHASDFSLASGAAPVSLVDGSEMHQLTIQCIPTELGERSAILTLTTNDPTTPVVTYPLICNGTTEATHAPLDLQLSNTQLSKETATGTVIGTLSTQEVDVTESHTYQLLLSAHGLFAVTGNELRLANPLTTNTPAYNIVVRSTDSAGLFIDRLFTLTVALPSTDLTETATEVVPSTNPLPAPLPTSTVFIPVASATGEGAVGAEVSSQLVQPLSAERLQVQIRTATQWGRALQIVGTEEVTAIGYLQPLPEQLGQEAEILIVYHWLPADGGGEMNFPAILPHQILTLNESNKMAVPLYRGQLLGLTGTFEVGLGYRLPTAGLFFADRVARLTLLPNHPPTKLTLSNQTIAARSPANTVIGVFQTTDQDRGDYFIYDIVSPVVSHFYPFKIIGNELQVVADFLLTAGEYPLTIKSLDTSGGSIEQSFVIRIE